MNIAGRKSLIAKLDGLADFAAPQPALEQVRTPGKVAIELVEALLEEGPLGSGVDLGCGTGVLSAACLELGATRMLGVDTDPNALSIAGRQLAEYGEQFSTLHADIAAARLPEIDFAISNPPFGAQLQNRGGDRPFLERGAECAKQFVFLQLPRNERFLQAFAKDLGKEVERIGEWSYPLPATMEHHAKRVVHIDVAGYLML